MDAIQRDFLYNEVVKDYYAILGVSPSATASDIKQAFRSLAVRYHPDKNPSAAATSRFHEINEAYDTLGDSGKRAQYDQRRANPFAELLSQGPAPTHRDPAYRRGRQPPKRGNPGPPASYILMRDSLKYVMWISRAGLLISALFFVDYFLPYLEERETIREITAVKLRRSVSYHLVVTASGREIKLYENKAMNFLDEKSIVMRLTPIYKTVIWASNESGTYREWVAYMYSTLIFFPLLLFLNSLLAVIYRKKVEFCFNLNITGGILLLITYILL